MLRPYSILITLSLAAFAVGLVRAQDGGNSIESAPESNRQASVVAESLSLAQAELQTLREQHAQLKLQMEALGIAAIHGDENSLRHRLLKAASDLAITEKRCSHTIELARNLAECAAAYMAKPGDHQVESAMKSAINSVSAFPKQHGSTEALSLDSARVVSYKSDMGLAVLNVGRDSGIRMGAPLSIVRADQLIASGIVVDVRDKISGILVTKSPSVQIKVGDSVKPELTQKSSN